MFLTFSKERDEDVFLVVQHFLLEILHRDFLGVHLGVNVGEMLAEEMLVHVNAAIQAALEARSGHGAHNIGRFNWLQEPWGKKE